MLRNALFVASVLLSGCAPWPEPSTAVPTTPAQAALGNHIAQLAENQVGVPYLYGGDTPSGFDCSGLVHYVYGEAGIRVPRTAEAQFNNLPRVPREQLQPGDLVFFRSDSGTLMHVGIYVGSGWFVHAPETNGTVSPARLDNPYWKDRYLGAGRPR